MKAFLKKVLGVGGYEALVKSVRKFVRAIDELMTVLLNILPSRLRMQIKSRLSIVRQMDYKKEKVLLDVASPMEYDVRINSCAKEPETIEWIEECFKPGDVIFDVGANVGAYSLIAASHLKTRLKIFAFEPSFLNFPRLCQNITLNGFSDSIVAFNVALSGKTGLNTFNYHNFTVGGAIHTLGDAIDYQKKAFAPVFKQTVISYTMDDFIAQFNIPTPNHLKLDVDGIEFEILKGASKTLSNPSLKTILVEMSEDETQMMDYIQGHGFKVHKRFVQEHPTLRFFNYIFVRA